MTEYGDPHLQRRSVLVAVVNNPTDLRRAASEGWYRIPQRRAPRRIGADYLAFYQTGAFKGQEEAHTVSYYAPIRRYQLLTRGEMIPEEADHPRAKDYYFRIEIGPLLRLDRAIPAKSMRRITFIHTSFGLLQTATDVTELFRSDDSFDALWRALHENRLRPLANRLAGDWPVDITLRVRNGYLGIRCQDDEAGAAEGRHQRPVPRWTLLHFSSQQLRTDLTGCLRQIASTLVSLGGSLDSRPGPELRL